MKLVVEAGAKKGTEIPLKKDKFIIGRSSDCTLRAGSDAISRHHCVIVKRESGYTIRDLGSRNGTYVNDLRIETETELSSGDAVRIGPLEFRFESLHDIKRDKKPKVKDVADAVGREASRPDESFVEDDISRWLLGPDPGSKASRETQSFRLDETHAMKKPAGPSESNSGEIGTDDEAAAEDVKATIEIAADDPSKSGKQKPGKLPPLPPKQTPKDSREAAANILREMTRRR
jgi:predicted component of type VI protein secretion system